MKELTQEQRDEIATLSNSDLPDEVYIDYLGDMRVDDFSDFDEAYSGKHRSDEEFAQDMAVACGYLPREPHWPLTCIDWEKAARELMYDYTEVNGHYFRDF